MATKLATKQVGSFAKDVDVQEFIFESGVKSSTRRPAALKDFYWDYVVIVLVSAILGLTLLDIAAEFFRGTGVRCFSPSTFEGNRQDFTRSQANFVNSFCYQSLPPSEYYSIFILAHGLGLVAPHYLWKVLFGGYFDFFFDLVKGLTRLRSSKTGDYDEMNFEIVRKLQKEYGESVRVFGLYIVKLSLQLGVAVFTLLMGAVYFKDFSPNFTCLDNCSRHYYPREMTNITCVYTSLRFLSIVRVVDMVFVGLTVPFILYGLGWCFIPHTRELGYAKTARFIADSCFLAEHYQPKHVHSVCSSQFRIVSDLNFFLMRLFRTDAGYGQVFREIQIEEEFIRLNKQDSEWLQLHYHSQTNMGDSGRFTGYNYIANCRLCTGKMARKHGHRTDSAWCRRTPCLHHLRIASVRLRTVSVRIGTASTTGFPLSKRSQYRLKRYANGLKRYANGASTVSVYSRLSPSYVRAYGSFSLCWTVMYNNFSYLIQFLMFRVIC